MRCRLSGQWLRSLRRRPAGSAAGHGRCRMLASRWPHLPQQAHGPCCRRWRLGSAGRSRRRRGTPGALRRVSRWRLLGPEVLLDQCSLGSRLLRLRRSPQSRRCRSPQSRRLLRSGRLTQWRLCKQSAGILTVQCSILKQNIAQYSAEVPDVTDDTGHCRVKHSLSFEWFYSNSLDHRLAQ